MISRSQRAERQSHHPQTFSYSCQAACVAMALARRGTESAATIETRLHGTHVGSHPINTVGTSEPGLSRLRTIDLTRTLLEQFRQSLEKGTWLVLHVSGPRWVARLPIGLVGPHGLLCAQGDSGRPFHSVLLVAAEIGRFFVLDPFLSRDGQPLEVPDDDLLFVLLGFDALLISL